MNKPFRALLLAITLPAMVIISSCRKDASLNTEPESMNQESSEARAKQKDILAWIDLHKQSYTLSQIKKLESVRNNLKFDELTVESRDNGDNLVIIPLKDAIKSTLAMNANSQSSLLIVQDKTGKFKFSHIVAYNSADGSNVSKLQAGTIQNLVNNKNVSYNGVFQFHSITGDLMFEQKYNDARLVSFSRIFTKRPTKSSNGISQECTDIYRTDFRFDDYDGHIITDLVVVGRNCNQTEENMPVGEQFVGNIPPQNPEPQSDLVFRYTLRRYVSVGELSYYDVSNPPTTTTEIEYDPDGNVIPPVASEVPVGKVFMVDVDFNKTDGQIVHVQVFGMGVTPAYSVYVNPTFGTITRLVNANTTYAGYTITNNIIHCTWQGNINFMWDIANSGASHTATQSFNYNFDIDKPNF